jgi:chloramphenicol 3-O phosphotransferase
LIILNGASSSGKSTLAAAMQVRLTDETWFHVSFDAWIAGSFPPRRYFDESAPGADAIINGFYAAVRAYIAAGNKVILDLVVGSDTALRRLAVAFEGISPLWVAVRCSPDELERRELIRGNRRLGLAGLQCKRLSASEWRYDVEVDTSCLAAWEAASAIFAAAATRAVQASCSN